MDEQCESISQGEGTGVEEMHGMEMNVPSIFVSSLTECLHKELNLVPQSVPHGRRLRQSLVDRLLLGVHLELSPYLVEGSHLNISLAT